MTTPDNAAATVMREFVKDGVEFRQVAKFMNAFFRGQGVPIITDENGEYLTYDDSGDKLSFVTYQAALEHNLKVLIARLSHS